MTDVLYLIMGVISCKSEHYQQIIQKYKQQIRRYIMEKKGKEFLDREITKTRKLVSELTKRYESYNLQSITKTHNQLKQYYNRITAQLNRRQLGGVTALEQMKGQTLDRILGLSYIQSLFDQLTTNVKKAFKEEELSIISQLIEIKQKYESEHQSQFSNRVMQSNIPSSQKQTMEQRLTMEFHGQISAYEQFLFESYRQILNNDNFQMRLKSIDCGPFLQTLQSTSKQKLQISMNLILGEKIDSFIIVE